MTLVEKTIKILELVEQVQAEAKESLIAKGVVIPDGKEIVLLDIPSLIDSVYQNDFEFFFNFQDVDQFGTPRYPRRGQASGGLILDLETAFAEPIVISMEFPNHFQPNKPPAGMFGVWCGGNTVFQGSLELEQPQLVAFDESPFPLVYHPSPDDTTTEEQP